MTRGFFGGVLAAGVFALCGAIAAPAVFADVNPFPRPAGIEPDVQFWIRVYTEVSTRGGLIHDSRSLGVVYEKIELPKGLSSRGRQRHVRKVKDRYKAILRSLARGKRTGLTRDESRVLALFPKGVSNSTLRGAASRLRFQLGQADKFRSGLIRSGAWEPHIRSTLEEMDLPVELAALPHVESSYTPHAYSRVGAAGLWQFTRSTGRRYMRVDHVVDERMDPYTATVAAARLLEQNRRTTGSWPLAITAYNHGAAGMRRAVRRLGTRDIEVVVRKYKSRTFGFASRNFYVEFLAAAEVDFNSERYFGPLVLDSPIEYETIALPYFSTANALAGALGVDRSVLKTSNPALRSLVWKGAKYVPRGYELRVPRAALSRPMGTAIASIPPPKRFSRQQRDTIHVVRRGETLSRIASRYGVRQSEVVALNNLRSRHRIRVGQKLRLPDPGKKVRVASVRAPSGPAELPDSGFYTVRRGDTLARIATRFGVSERDIVRANGLPDRNRIYVGQRLKLAALGTAAPPARAKASHPEAHASLSKPRKDETEELESALAAAPGVAAADEAPEPTAAPGLAADPNDYSVDRRGRVEVQAAETLGHYAEWLNVRASTLRRLNGMRYGQALQIGRHVELDFSRVSPEIFETRRVEYHRGLQGEFFASFEIHGTRTHKLRRGDSLWQLAQRKYHVPIWLLRQYNPDLDFDAAAPGTRITIPLIRPHEGAGADVAAPPDPNRA